MRSAAVRLSIFQIADDALPAAAVVRGKGALVIGGDVRLETEYFDARAGRLVENQPGSDHFRVVEYEHRTLRQKPPDPLEAVLGDAAVAADEQLRLARAARAEIWRCALRAAGSRSRICGCCVPWAVRMTGILLQRK